MAVIEEVTAAYEKERVNPEFLDTLDDLQANYAGRPSPLYEATRLSEHAGSARIFLKREDLNHTGSHKINNVLGQALLAKRMGKTRVIAETGAGQHGVATATACALLGLRVRDLHGRRRHCAPGAQRGADAAAGRRGRLGRDGFENTQGRHQRGVPGLGHQRRQHVLLLRHCGRTASLPDHGARFPAHHRPGGARTDPGAGGPVARRGRGLRRRRIQRHRDLPRLLDDPGVRLVGYEAAGDGVETGRHAATFTGGSPGRVSGIVLLPAARRGRPDHRIPFDLSGSGLSGGGSGTRVAQGNRTRRIPADHRLRGDGGVRPAVPHGRHHPGHRIRACGCRRPQARQRIGHGAQSLW